jgi:DNA topoisomerase-1
LSAARRRRGWTRRGGPKRFTYLDTNGERIVDEEALERIRSLVIPPAWREVWISPNAGAKLQATGYDAAGRRQYLYNPAFRAKQERQKFERLLGFGEALPALRSQVAADMAGDPLEFDWTSAVAITLVNRGWFRAGSERAARTMRTYGITTLTKRHVEIQGQRLHFRYRGKHRVLNRTTLVDEELAAAMRELIALPGSARIFRYRRDDGPAPLTAPLLNEYLHSRMDVIYSVKDFRTWGGTLTAAISLAEHGPPQSAADERRALAAAFRSVAEELGNTPAVARSSYVSPVVVDRFHQGIVLETVRPKRERILSGGSTTLSPEEEALLELLGRSS